MKTDFELFKEQLDKSSRKEFGLELDELIPEEEVLQNFFDRKETIEDILSYYERKYDLNRMSDFWL